ncbi:MAG: hypothetical protein IPM48_14715 [Saprospiraceae bacterium]|nr:hypothetical protein [Saprospiraceae bacterium]
MVTSIDSFNDGYLDYGVTTGTGFNAPITSGTWNGTAITVLWRHVTDNAWPILINTIGNGTSAFTS